MFADFNSERCFEMVDCECVKASTIRMQLEFGLEIKKSKIERRVLQPSALKTLAN